MRTYLYFDCGHSQISMPPVPDGSAVLIDLCADCTTHGVEVSDWTIDASEKGDARITVTGHVRVDSRELTPEERAY